MFILIWRLYSISRRLNQLRTWSRPPLLNEESETKQSVFRRLSTQITSFLSSIRSSLSSSRGGDHQQNDVLNRVDRSASLRPIRSNSIIANRTNEFNMQRDLVAQALLYSGAFVVIYLCSFIFRIIEQKTGSPPFFLAVLVRILNPLQGKYFFS